MRGASLGKGSCWWECVPHQVLATPEHSEFRPAQGPVYPQMASTQHFLSLMTLPPLRSQGLQWGGKDSDGTSAAHTPVLSLTPTPPKMYYTHFLNRQTDFPLYPFPYPSLSQERWPRIPVLTLWPRNGVLRKQPGSISPKFKSWFFHQSVCLTTGQTPLCWGKHTRHCTDESSAAARGWKPWGIEGARGGTQTPSLGSRYSPELGRKLASECSYLPSLSPAPP